MKMSNDVKELKQDRDKTIVRTSVIGIGANLALAAAKASAGMVANSIAMVLDAVNNLSDVLSSVITIIGTRLAGRAPDKKHPLGHGRIEYLSTMIIAAIVLYAGITALIESVKKIISPETPAYSWLTLGIIMADSAAGDLMIVWNILRYRSEASRIVYIDHPTQAGGVIFEK